MIHEFSCAAERPTPRQLAIRAWNQRFCPHAFSEDADSVYVMHMIQYARSRNEHAIADDLAAHYCETMEKAHCNKVNPK